jgi:hypothetical protein
MALNTVGDYIAEARRLLQDAVTPYRYSDADMIAALNIGLLEAKRLRRDLFLGRDAPSYATTGQTVEIDEQYRPALAYYITGRIGIRDAEPNQDARATVMMNKFVAQLLTIQA